MSIFTLAVKGIPYQSYKKISITKSMDALCGAFSFTAVDPTGFTFPFKVGDPCTVAIDGVLVITGFIDKIQGSYDHNSHELTVSGRDKTSDIVDSTVGGNISFKPPISLESVIQNTLSLLKITGINVVNTVQGLAPFQEGDLVAPKVGDTVFKFIEGYARKRQVLLTTDASGTLILTRSSGKNVNQSVINESNNSGNNVLGASFTYDNSKRFNSYTFWSQLNPTALGLQFDADKANSVDQQGLQASARGGRRSKKIVTAQNNAIDASVRTSRVCNRVAERSMPPEDLLSRAKWEANYMRAKAITYSPRMQGVRFNANSPLWEVNTIVIVRDTFANLESEMLINSVTFELDDQSGTTTTLGLVEKDTYQIKIEIDKADQKSNIVAPKLIFDPVRANARTGE